MVKIDITSMDGLNKAHAALLQQIREARYALAAVELVSAVKSLELGLVTTPEMIAHCGSIVFPAVTLEILKPGDTDLITGQIIPTKTEAEALLAKITG